MLFAGENLGRDGERTSLVKMGMEPAEETIRSALALAWKLPTEMPLKTGPR